MLDGTRNHLMTSLTLTVILSGVVVGQLMNQISNATILHLDLLYFLILIRIISVGST